ncbi:MULTISPECIES: CRISPR system precrRNA processing endoribonuclease RAMP protein Cas6 [unclassified Actinomyces]|uniref:CRISPR system precrRNA processing endoribonuclease RAMP protein Cas6 n=1 Tax=unclassified Actinomyces TaxID=2609248 RepID=UPI000D5A101F|nr:MULTISPECIES: CRISPR system precrRNA processing endoribonuclease RAMP protein Cas6 [unclassified Actinomyces]RAX24198.1 CRISPR system precrRNA processing endoribonuclease RAMP protein Cas6 [Actinomyces sp. Z3]
MPSTVFLQFDAPDALALTPRRLHAAWGRVLELPEGISPERAALLPSLAARPPHNLHGPKPYSVGQMTEQPGMIGAELRLLDDRLLDNLDGWLAWGGVLPLGDGSLEGTALVVVTEAQILERVSWEELAEDDASTTWDVTLLSPTVFTSRGRHVPGVTPEQLATSLHARWHAWSPQTEPPRLHRDDLDVLTMQDRTEPVRVNLGMPSADRRGRLTRRSILATEGSLRISGVVGAATTRVFSRLMSLARFTNVGSHAAYGMGTLDVIANP